MTGTRRASSCGRVARCGSAGTRCSPCSGPRRGGEPDAPAVEAAQEAEAASNEAHHAAKGQANEARDGRTRADIALATATQAEGEAKDALGKVQAKPAQDAWAALGAEIEVRSLAAGIFAEPVMAAVRDTASIQLSQLARAAQEVLRAHLEHAAHAVRLIAMMEGGHGDDLRWEHYVRTWLGVGGCHGAPRGGRPAGGPPHRRRGAPRRALASVARGGRGASGGWPSEHRGGLACVG